MLELQLNLEVIETLKHELAEQSAQLQQTIPRADPRRVIFLFVRQTPSTRLGGGRGAVPGQGRSHTATFFNHAQSRIVSILGMSLLEIDHLMTS